MNLINLSKSSSLNDAVKLVEWELAEAVKNNSYISYQIKETRFNRFSDITITAEILLRDENGITVKRVSYVVIDGVIFKSLPHKALCEEV